MNRNIDGDFNIETPKLRNEIDLENIDENK